MSKITIDRSVVEQALEALTNCYSTPGHRCNRCDSEVDEGGNVAATLRAALEQPPRQPLTCNSCKGLGRVYRGCNEWAACVNCNTTGIGGEK